MTDGFADASASKCNGLVREKELEPWVGDNATTEDGLEAIEDSVVDGFDRNEVMCRQLLIIIMYETHSQMMFSVHTVHCDGSLDQSLQPNLLLCLFAVVWTAVAYLGYCGTAAVCRLQPNDFLYVLFLMIR